MKVIGFLVVLAAACIGIWLDEAWWLMLAVGDIHRNWWPAVPLMGFKAALPIGFCLAVFLSVTVGVVAAVHGKK